MDDSDIQQKQPAKKRLRRLPTFFFLYILCVVVLYGIPYLSEPDTTFTGRTLRDFSIAAVSTNPEDAGSPYRFLTLESVRSPGFDASGLTFLLPAPSVTINVGDIHVAKVLEDDGKSQLIAFHYSNTHTSVSIYRAYDKRVEPVSFRVTSSVVQFFIAVLLLPAVFAVTLVVVPLYNRIVSGRNEQNTGST